MSNFKITPSRVREIRQGSEDFMLDDGMIRYPRAMIHLHPDCPWQVRDQVNFAVAKGWLTSVAHVYDNELMWDKLSESSD